MDDFALALQLQEEFDREAALSASSSGTGSGGAGPYSTQGGATGDPVSDLVSWEKRRGLSPVDPQWELLDPIPDIRALFLEFNDTFFWGRLAGIEVKWSPRMTLCAGLCCYEGRGGLCSVRLSTPLLKLRPRKDLIETLLHEMIHAYLFVTDNNKDHDGHGPEFHKHMYRINKATGANISVYHTFHDEVDNYRQHWWRCDGPCRSRPPYFGYVKRAMNRPPTARDPWWPQHQQTCGGTYTKVKEPEGYGEKKSKKNKDEQKVPEKPTGAQDIRKIFGGKGVTIGGGSLAKPGPSSSTSSADKKPNASHRPDLPQLPSTSQQEVDAAMWSDSDEDFSTWDVPDRDENKQINGKLSDSDLSTKVDTCDKQNNAGNKTKPSLSGEFNSSKTTSKDQINSEPGEVANVRVRKLPAFGLIVSERPRGPLEPVTNISGKDDVETDSKSRYPGKDLNSSKSPVVIDNDDDLDTDRGNGSAGPTKRKKEEISNKKSNGSKNHKHSGSLKDWLRNAEDNHPPPGVTIKIPGFTSVSNKKSSPSSITREKEQRDRDRVRNDSPTSSPRARNKEQSGRSKVRNDSATSCAEIKNNEKTGRLKIRNDSPSTSSGTRGKEGNFKTWEPRNKAVPVGNYAADRNARAHAISDGDQSTDEEENQPLSSSIKQPLKHNTNSAYDKKRHLSGSAAVPEHKRAKTEPPWQNIPRNEIISWGAGSETNRSRDEDDTRWQPVPNDVSVAPPTNQDDPTDPLQTCPVCQVKVKASKINDHLDMCLS